MKQIVFLSIILSFLSCFVKNENVLASGSTNASITSRILGGEDADIRHFRYQLSLRLNGGYICSACRITQVDAITAGHCITHMAGIIWPYTGVTIHGGTALFAGEGNVYTIKRINVHPGWTGTEESSGNHDIAHVKMNEVAVLNEFENVAHFPQHDVVSFSIGLVSGWGDTDLENPGPAEILQYIDMFILRYHHCQQFMLPHFILHPEQLCAFQTAGHGCCRGDSGAPLVINFDVVGLHSSTRIGFTGAGGEPEIFTNVCAQQDFIDMAMQLQ